MGTMGFKLSKKSVLIALSFVFAVMLFAFPLVHKWIRSNLGDGVDSSRRAAVHWDAVNAEKRHVWKNPGGAYNVVFITVNLMRVDHLSCYGYERETTPAIDALAREAFVFSNMFTNSDYTMPNMMSIITSLFPVGHGVYDAFKDELTVRVKTLAEILRLSGYRTSWFALQPPHLDTAVGFGRGYDVIKKLNKDHSNIGSVREWIRNHRDQPFFVGLNSRSIHPPYLPPSEFKDVFQTVGSKGEMADTREEFHQAWYKKILELMETPGSVMHEVIDDRLVAENHEVFDGEYKPEKLAQIRALMPKDKQIRFGFSHILTFSSMINTHDRKNIEYAISLYDGCLLGIDQKLVRPIVDTLKEAGVYDKTIIVITGDHGESIGEHHYVGHNLNFYEQLIHVPLLIRHPDLKTRVNIADLAQSVDILPTILDLLHIKQPFHAQGKSLMPLLLDNASAPINAYVYGQKRKQAYIRSDTWKLVVDREHEKDEKACHLARLFNIKTDRGESRNLCKDEPRVFREMMAKLNKHLDATPKYIDKEYRFLPGVDEKTRKRIRETGYW